MHRRVLVFALLISAIGCTPTMNPSDMLDASVGDASAMDAGAGDAAVPDLGAGACANVKCTAMDACHLAGTCDPGTGKCSNPSAADNTPCTTVFPNAKAVCQAGACVLGGCDTGFKNCDANDANGCEANLAADPNQCGACGSVCVVPNATATCVSGTCRVGACIGNFVDCDGDVSNGCESDPGVDPKNCSKCGQPCPTGESCVMGVCSLVCAKGKANCNNDSSDGCETPLHTNTNCAFCGDTCNPANSTSHCDATGICILDTCNSGFMNCDMVAANGCETNVKTDASNCASCGNQCPSGPHSTAICQGGGCGIACDPGYSDCDNHPSNGCEIHSDVDTANCGACTKACTLPNATAGCAGGSCTITSCAAGFVDCNSAVADGCEVNQTSDPSNCRGCGMKCNLPNALAGCTNASCTITTCNPGYSDCDNDPTNGCETPNGTDVNNCGSCKHTCSIGNGTASCSGGVCAVAACNAGYTDCNSQASDGCEVHTSNDPFNCGSCNHQCFIANGVAGCVNGTCKVATCNSGWSDCDNNPANGCETNLTTDITNCGQCGHSCNNSVNCSTAGGATVACAAGACRVSSCGGGHFDIDASCSDGCECTSSGTGPMCAAPSSLGTLAIGLATSYTGNLVPLGQQAYLAVTFTGQTNTAYAPHIKMTAGTSEFTMDILINCAGGTIAANTQDWQASFNGGVPVGTNGTVLIRVYRKTGLPVSCNTYALTITN